jgi:hypothetical protein
VFSKLERHTGPVPVPLLPAPDPAALAPLLQAPLDGLRPVGGGTSGVCFKATLAGRPVFLKTHATAAGRTRLRREATLLEAVHGRELGVCALETFAPARSWLLCDELPELARKLSPADVAAVVAHYQERLEAAGSPIPALPLPDFGDLLSAGAVALARLGSQGLLAPPLERWLADALARLGEAAAWLPRVVCHGDLGPRNLLRSSSRPVAIDWEDAFRGIQGYDRLYWLSFMENAPWMQAGWARLTELPPELERGLLGVIVLLKSHLALAAGTYQQQRVPFARRLGEVLALPLPA